MSGPQNSAEEEAVEGMHILYDPPVRSQLDQPAQGTRSQHHCPGT